MKTASNLAELEWLVHGFYTAADSGTVPAPIVMNQVHSADIAAVVVRPAAALSVDGLVTAVPNLNLTVKTADCAPVLLADPVTRQVAAVHAGWRGAFQGVIENAILEMVKRGAKVADMRAAVGPHIQQKSFQAGAEMRALFPATEARFFTEKDGVLYFDFDAYVCYRLKRAGIGSVESVGDDTYSDTAYFSYRREPENPGRQYSSIMIKGENHVG